MICPRCKKLIVNAVFGVACTCAVLTGKSDEPMHEYPFQSPKVSEVTPVASTARAPTSAIFDWRIGSDSS